MRKRIGIIFLVFIATFFYHSLDVDAAVKGEGTSAYCILCDETNSDSYKWEQQFKERIRIIKLIYGDSINEVALAATVLHAENALSAVQSRYEEDFDSDAYTESLNDIQNNHTPISGSIKTEDDLRRESESNTGAQIDLLNAAAIVMADSAGWDNGQYNEDNYKKALAGDKLFGNDNGPFSDLYNGIYCGLGGATDLVFTGLNITNQFLTGQDIMTETERSSKRFHNMASICLNGYIGGVYDINETTVPDDEVRQLKKERIADEIIDLIHYYCDLSGDCEIGQGQNDVCPPEQTSGNFSNWKQYEGPWENLPVGNGGSLASIGCLVTSTAIQVARSGTQTKNLPSGYSSFDPGAWITSLNNNGGIGGGGIFLWTGHEKIAPNVKYGDPHSVSISDNKTLAQTLKKELSTGAEGKYQKFIIIGLSHSGSSEHYVAVDSVGDDSITIFDPGASGNTLDQNYQGWHVFFYRVMYATDVLVGKTGSSNSSGCGDNATSGTIKIPKEYGNGGYTVTYYHNDDNDWNWDRTSNQGKLYYDYWIKNPKYEKGIAVYDNRFLIACTETFGDVGDKVDFFLEDGTKIPCIIADSKNPADEGYNKWGHENGQNVLEFEVSRSYMYNEAGGSNPGNNGWYSEWGGKRVASATNLGSIW